MTLEGLCVAAKQPRNHVRSLLVTSAYIMWTHAL